MMIRGTICAAVFAAALGLAAPAQAMTANPGLNAAAPAVTHVAYYHHWHHRHWRHRYRHCWWHHGRRYCAWRWR